MTHPTCDFCDKPLGPIVDELGPLRFCSAHCRYLHIFTDKKHDPVNHPSHYTSHPSSVECIQITEHMSFNIGNAIKYLWRNGLKDGTPATQDLEKAAWYINREIQRLNRTNAVNADPKT